MPELDAEAMKQRGRHSVHGLPDSEETGGVRFEEFVVYDPAQTLPTYVVLFRTVSAKPVAKLAVAGDGTATPRSATGRTVATGGAARQRSEVPASELQQTVLDLIDQLLYLHTREDALWNLGELCKTGGLLRENRSLVYCAETNDLAVCRLACR